VNHTTLIILAVLVADALVTGMFATGIQAAQAGGGRHKYRGAGDSVAFEQENKQKAKCLALVISRADACNQEARNNFNVNVPGEEERPEAQCLAAFPATTFNVEISAAIAGTPVEAGDEICVAQLGNHATFDLTQGVEVELNVANPNATTCPPGTVAATVNSITPDAPQPIELGDTVCIHLGPI
jgi:hypothetical protein